jgi:hypothetical protein
VGPTPRATDEVAFVDGPQRVSRIREKVESRVSKFTALRSLTQKARADPPRRQLTLRL